MLKKSIIFLFFMASLNGLFAQEYDQISIGSEYADQTYYSLKHGTIQSNDYRVWDIAFSTQGSDDAGIFINEAAHINANSQLELYHVPNASYDQTIVLDTASWRRLYNPDVNWQTGAFNTIASDTNPLDYGWGVYDPNTMVITGSEVYVIRLRNGIYKKLFIQTLTDEYKFKYANLNGSDEKLNSIIKTENGGKVLSHFSLENNTVVNIEPDSWDLIFTRYMDYVSLGNGNDEYLDYVITGVLSGVDVQVAQADGVIPSDAEEGDYLNLYTPLVDEIGYDWKSFNLSLFQYSILDDRVYFVKNNDNDICKITFIDFEGPQTGVTTIFKECNIVADADDVSIHGLKSINVFPNPANTYVDVALDFEKKTEAQLSVIDITGKTHLSNSYSFSSGFQSTRLELNIPSGNYYILIQTPSHVQQIPIVITQ